MMLFGWWIFRPFLRSPSYTLDFLQPEPASAFNPVDTAECEGSARTRIEGRKSREGKDVRYIQTAKQPNTPGRKKEKADDTYDKVSKKPKQNRPNQKLAR